MTGTLAPVAVSIPGLIEEAAERGLLVFAKAGRMVVVGPTSTDSAFIALLRDHRTTLLQTLDEDDADGERFMERTAIAEADGGLSPADATLLAWREWRAAWAQRSRKSSGPSTLAETSSNSPSNVNAADNITSNEFVSLQTHRGCTHAHRTSADQLHQTVRAQSEAQ